MQKIFVLKDYKDYEKGKVYSINENDAHTLIDQGYACLEGYKDKMMRPNAKHINTKQNGSIS
jgi:hypothetical protein